VLDSELERLGVSRESRDRLEAYLQLLLEWQAKINLIGPSTVSDAWNRHILDSLQLLPFIKGEDRSLADLGSGAGIPGLVLAIGGNIPAELYESNGKKAAFLQEAIRRTGADARVHRMRLEDLGRVIPDKIPRYVTARALAPLVQLLEWAAPFLTRGAVGLFHKGQDVDVELTEATKSWKMQIMRHPSLTDSKGVILEIKDLTHGI
jgi:16S rRNA (guanine527-N7)-methyltransferase